MRYQLKLLAQRTLEKTKARVPSNLLPPKVDVKEDVDVEKQVEEIEKDSTPQEISSLKDDEDIVFKVENIEDVPSEYKDRVKESSSSTITTRETIFGLPIGKKEIESKTNLYYTLTGKEVKDQYQQQANETKRCHRACLSNGTTNA